MAGRAVKTAALEARAIEAETAALKARMMEAEVAAMEAEAAAMDDCTADQWKEFAFQEEQEEERAEAQAEVQAAPSRSELRRQRRAEAERARAAEGATAALAEAVGKRFRASRKCAVRAGFALKSAKVAELTRGTVSALPSAAEHTATAARRRFVFRFSLAAVRFDSRNKTRNKTPATAAQVVTALDIRVLRDGRARLQCEKGWVSYSLLVELPPPARLSTLYGNITSFQKKQASKASKAKPPTRPGAAPTSNISTLSTATTRRQRRRRVRPQSAPSPYLKNGYIGQGLAPVPLRVQKTPLGGYPGTAFIWHPDPQCESPYSPSSPTAAGRGPSRSRLRPSSAAGDFAGRALQQQQSRSVGSVGGGPVARPGSAGLIGRAGSALPAEDIWASIAAPSTASTFHAGEAPAGLLKAPQLTVNARSSGGGSFRPGSAGGGRPGSAGGRSLGSRPGSAVSSRRPMSASSSTGSYAKEYVYDPCRMDGNPRGYPPTARRKPAEECPPLEMTTNDFMKPPPPPSLSSMVAADIAQAEALQVGWPTAANCIDHQHMWLYSCIAVRCCRRSWTRRWPGRSRGSVRTCCRHGCAPVQPYPMPYPGNAGSSANEARVSLVAG